MSGDQEIRFAVGEPGGSQSAVWLIFTRGGESDIYVANQYVAGLLKVRAPSIGLRRPGCVRPSECAVGRTP